MESYFGGSPFGYKSMFMILHEAQLFFLLIFTKFEIVYATDARTSSIKCDEN